MKREEIKTLTELYDYINTLTISDEDKEFIIDTIAKERQLSLRLADNDANLRAEIERLKQDNQMCRLTINQMVKVPYTYGIRLNNNEEEENNADNNR